MLETRTVRSTILKKKNISPMITSNTFKILSIVQTDNSLRTAPRLVARAFQSPLESSKSFNYYPVALQLPKKERLLFKKKNKELYNTNIL
jgi:hypothetical protein